MTGPEAKAAYLAFQNAPSVREIAAALPCLGEHTAAVLAELARDPSPDRCDRALCQLAGARELVARLRGSLIREGESGGQR